VALFRFSQLFNAPEGDAWADTGVWRVAELVQGFAGGVRAVAPSPCSPPRPRRLPPTYVCISHTTYEGCAGRFECRRLAKVTVPGKAVRLFPSQDELPPPPPS